MRPAASSRCLHELVVRETVVLAGDLTYPLLSGSEALCSTRPDPKLLAAIELADRSLTRVYGAVTIYNAGWITGTASAVGNPYLFTGRRFDPESGNYYYRARVYSPALDRFLSMDPLGSMAEDYNLYRYVHNNVLNRVDPTGYQDEESFGEHLSKWWHERLLPAVDEAFYHVPSKGSQGLQTAAESVEVLWNEKDRLVQRANDRLFQRLEEAPSECGGCWSLDAVGWRVEASASMILGVDANVDLIYNLRTSEFDVFFTGGGVVAAGVEEPLQQGGHRQSYDGNGVRVEKEVVGGETTVYVGPHFEVAISGTQVVSTSYYYAPSPGSGQGLEQPVAMRTQDSGGDTVRYLHGDHPSLLSGQAWAARAW
jgi:RHS repeat-associated protein